MERKIKLVINPAAGNHKISRIWPDVKKRLEKVLGNFSYDFTQKRDDAIHLTRRALRDGYENIVAVGGDGTINEVVNGFFEDDRQINSAANLGIISTGTGGDLVRTLHLPDNIEATAECILQNKTKSCDLGLLKCESFAGGQVTRYFINIADAGFGGEVARRVNNSGKAFGRLFSYLTGLLRTLRTYENKPIQIQVDDHFSKEQIVNSVVVANGQYFGGGMWIAPKAEIGDGQFEVIILGDMTRIEAISNIPKIYSGTLSNHPKVTTLQGKKVTLDSEESVVVEADGELPGKLPASFEIFQGAINIIC